MKRNKITALVLSVVMSLSLMTPSLEVMADETTAPSETQKIESTETKEPKTTERSTSQSTEKKESKVAETHEPKETAKQELEETQKKESVSVPTETQNSETTMGSECEPSQTRNTEDSKGKDTETSETQPSQSSETSAVEPTGTQETVTTARPDTPIVVKRNAKNITVSEIQTKLNTKMKQTGYVPGGKPPSSYENGRTCYGFVDSLCRYLFGHGLPSIAGSKYALVSSSNLSQVGNTLTYSAGNTSSSQLKNLFLSCQPGDVVQMNYISDKAVEGSADYHTLMIYSVSESGVVFYHAGSSKVWYGGLWSTTGRVFTWSSFASWFGEAGDGISVYRSKQSNGTPLPVTTWINASCGPSTTTGTNVTLTWGASNAASYWLHIYKDGADYYNAGQEGRTSWSHTFNSAGTYTCYITPYGKWDYISSSQGTNASVTITVSAPNPLPTGTWIQSSCSYIQTGSNHKFTIAFGANNATGYRLSAYQNDKLYFADRTYYTTGSYSFSDYCVDECVLKYIVTPFNSYGDGPSATVSFLVFDTPITVAVSGKCGENLTWRLDTYGTLTITGNGNMYDYVKDYSPWYDYKNSILKIVISDGVTSIGGAAFSYFKKLQSVYIPESVTSIASGAFTQSAAADVYYGGAESDWNKISIVGAGGNISTLFSSIIHYDKYTLSLADCVNGSASLSKYTAKPNELITVNIEPAEGYALDTIKVNGEIIRGFTFDMPSQNVTVEVTFKKAVFTVSLAELDPKNGSASLSQNEAFVGDEVKITVNPAKGYELDTISVNGTPISELTFKMPAQNVNVIVSFKLTEYTISINADSHIHFVNPKTTAVYGEQVSIAFTIDEGFYIDIWSAGPVGIYIKNNTINFTMPYANVWIRLSTSDKKYTVSVNETNNGTISVPMLEAMKGEKIEFTVKADDGYEIDEIKVSGAVVYPQNEGEYYFNMPSQNVVVEVAFKKIEQSSSEQKYTVSVKELQNGTVSFLKDEAKKGEKIGFVVKADEGYEIDEIKASGTVVYPENEGEYYFDMPEQDVVVEVAFKKKELSLSLRIYGRGIVTLSKEKACIGDQITVNPIPDEGYYFEFLVIMSDNLEYIYGNTFTMPGVDVVVGIQFAPKYETPVGESVTIGENVYKVIAAPVNGVGGVSLISTTSSSAKISVPDVISIRGVEYKVLSIANNAFSRDYNLTTLVIGNNVTTIGANAFLGCKKLVKVSGGARVKTIGTKAFASCTKLQTFVVTSPYLAKIGAYAFSGDKSLKTIYIKNTVKLSKKGVKKSLKSSKIKTVKVKKSKVKKYKKYFKKSNSGRTVKVKK